MRKILVFCPNVKSSKRFAAIASLAGLTCRHIDGESPNRKELKRGHEEWKPPGPGEKAPFNTFQILTNPLLLGRGYDSPSIDCVINLRPCRSKPLYSQILGRGTRLFCPWGCGEPCPHDEAKRDLLFLDFLWQFKAMAPMSPADLLTDAPGKKAQIEKMLNSAQGALDLRQLDQDGSAAMMQALVDAMLEAQQKAKGYKAGEYFNALDFAANLQLPDLASYQPETDAEAEPASDRQLKRLAKQGIRADTIVCAGHAEALECALHARKEAGLAGMKSVFWLRKWGYENPEQITADRAKKILAREFRSRGKF